jgi:hypothetical protein
MNKAFTSVILFYAALRDLLLTEAGMTVARSLGLRDLILTGAGTAARVRLTVVSPTVSAVCITLGTDLDVLEAVPEDPELFFPFDTTTLEQFGAYAQWAPDRGVLSLLLYPSVLPGSSYRAEINFQQGSTWIRRDPSTEVGLRVMKAGV